MQIGNAVEKSTHPHIPGSSQPNENEQSSLLEDLFCSKTG
jgi:hypothetical protein